MTTIVEKVTHPLTRTSRNANAHAKMDAQGALKIAGIASVRFPAFKTTDASRWPRCAMTSTIGENIFSRRHVRPSSSRPPFTTDESLLPTRSPRAQAGYSAQMIGVPTMANKLYFKEGVRVRSA